MKYLPLILLGACSANSYDHKASSRVNSPQLIAPKFTLDAGRNITYLQVRDFEEKDLRIFNTINAILETEGFTSIPENSKINLENMTELRQIYERNKRETDKARDDWLNEANKQLAPIRAKLIERINAGQTEDLPVRSEDNDLKRNHPYEAICEVICGRSYVLRVHPDQAPKLKELGDIWDLEKEQRIIEFNSIIRKLFERNQ